MQKHSLHLFEAFLSGRATILKPYKYVEYKKIKDKNF